VRAAATPGGSVADPNLFDRLYSYAWFVTFGLSFIVYLALMRGAPGTSSRGSGVPGTSSRGSGAPDTSSRGSGATEGSSQRASDRG
jgi:hypothetical protein